MQSTMMRDPLTLDVILERAGRQFANREIVSRMPDKSLHRTSYGDMRRRSRALAERLRAAGIVKGDRVATLMWNHAWHLEAYFGIPAVGAVLHTLNLRLGPDDLAYIIQHAGDKILIVDDVLLPLYEKVKDRVHFERVLVVPLTGKPVPEAYEDYERFITEANGHFEYAKLDENDAAGMCYTSGTTGRPKGVVYSHRAIVLHSIVSAMADTLGPCERDVSLPVVPMFHVNAWGLPFTLTLVGSKLVLPGPHLDPESLLDLFAREQVTFTAGVPTIWMGILDQLDRNPGKWKLTPGMRMVVGGSAAPESLLRGFDRHGLKVVHAWGMTETTPLGTVANLQRHQLDWPVDAQYATRAKQGSPAAFVQVRAMTENGEAAWDGKTMGELQVRGPWVAASYYKLEEEADKWTKDGWFRTGDVVTIDADGFVKITDRTKDLIKSGGEWISSVDLENALMGYPAIKEAAVIAVHHPKWSERPLAVVVLKEGAKATGEELSAFLAQRFAKFQVPDAYAFVDAIPKTSTGKFQKLALRERFKDWKW